MKWRVLFFLLAAAVAGAGADAATLSLKVFDRIAKDVELAYIRAGTSEIVRVPMERVMFGVWQADVPVAKGDYEYRFVVDGEWMSDISNREINRWDDGSVWSRISVKGDDDVVANYRIPEPKTPDVGVW